MKKIYTNPTMVIVEMNPKQVLLTTSPGLDSEYKSGDPVLINALIIGDFE